MQNGQAFGSLAVVRSPRGTTGSARGPRYALRVSFEPDILIVDSEDNRPLVVIEAKLRAPDPRSGEEQLKRYMQATRSPVGMLATPEKLWIYADRLRTSAPDSVVNVGEYSLGGIIGGPRPGQRPDVTGPEFAFEAALQDWIEKLASEGYRQTLPQELRDAVEEYVVPALSSGEVRAAGPRWYRDDSLSHGP